MRWKISQRNKKKDGNKVINVPMDPLGNTIKLLLRIDSDYHKFEGVFLRKTKAVSTLSVFASFNYMDVISTFSIQ